MEEEFKSYKPAHTKKEVGELIEHVFNDKVESLDRKNLGEINAVYFAKLRGGPECVIRISPKERNYNAFKQEAWAFKKARAVGVPTPEVLAIDTSQIHFPEAYMITRKIPGMPGDKAELSDEQKLRVLKELGHYTSLIHSVKIRGFGRLEEQGEEFVGRHNSLWENVMHEFEHGWWLDTVLREGLLSRNDIQNYKTGFEQHKSLFDLDSASLIHGDLSLKNVLVDETKITGIVDMENILATDPIHDFQLFHFWNEGREDYFNALKSGYDNKDLFDGNFMKKLYLYQLLFSSSLLAYYHNRNNQYGLDFVYRRIPVIREQLDKEK